MMRCFTALVAGLLIAGLSTAADSKTIVIRWHGQSCFELISSKGTRVVFDPHAIEAYGRKMLKADLVLISHDHNDHTQIGIIENREKAKVIRGLKGLGKKQEWVPINEQFKDIHVRSVGVYHDTRQGLERGKNTVFVLDVDGLKVVFLGDLGHILTDEQVKQIGPVDVLMIPIGGVYTINGSEAKKVVEQLKPKKYILPMHYGTKVYDDLLPADEFLEDQKKANIRQLGAVNQLRVETGSKEAEPIIVLLYWK
jgi:L-ascorbate metabolism protein UlaG (beta-lactamase superfamily)